MKPYLICHMVTSIDGRIMGGRWGRIPGQPDLTALYEKTAASFGVASWIVGTTTMKEFAGRAVKIKPSKRKITHEDYIAARGAKGYAIGVDPKGRLPWSTGFLEDGEHVISLLSRRVCDNYLAHLQSKGGSYLFCGDEEIDLRVALDKLARQFKLKKLMLEGGGKINGSFLRESLVDEISHITVPVADGGTGVSTIFDIPGTPPRKAAAHLRLLSQKRLPGGVLWARYRVTR